MNGLGVSWICRDCFVVHALSLVRHGTLVLQLILVPKLAISTSEEFTPSCEFQVLQHSFYQPAFFGGQDHSLVFEGCELVQQSVDPSR